MELREFHNGLLDTHVPTSETDATCERCEQDFVKNKYSLCTDPWGGHAELVCDACQERAYDREQECLMEDGPGPSLLDQQIAAQKFK